MGDLAVAAVLDPLGAAAFEAAALEVLTGRSGLHAIEAEIGHLGRSLVNSAKTYVEVELDQQTALLRTTLLVAAAAIATPDRSPSVTAVAVTGIVDTPPRSLADLMTHLGDLNNSRQDGQGDIDIQTLTGTDANGNPVRKIIVYLPGVDDWDPLDLGDVNDVTNAARPILGESSTYEYGVLAALHAAGVSPTDDVTLVGHSQGGAVAVDTARDAVRSGQFDVTHVVTAGAPIGVAARSLPSSVKVLALENVTDIVPATDGALNPRRPNITTVTVDRPQLSPADSHDVLTSYVPGARDVDAGSDPAAEAYLERDSALFQLDRASTVRFSITRS